ncbi:MAG: FAD:protein FMN transferase [Verrucomicrobia bacterium]|nr:FAD:protein FMN transferase [Verrucomicrobiota bacterium]
MAEARAKVGWHLVALDEAQGTVRFSRDGVMLDLGAIGKGYALERAAEILREAGVTSGLIHGGTSTVCAIGAPPGEAAWKIAIDHPANNAAAKTEADSGKREPPLAVVPLKNEALSVSAVWGKSFQSGGRTYGHVIDQRTGEPAQGAALAAVVLPSATETDAFSTALLTLGLNGLETITSLRPEMKALVGAVDEETKELRTKARGIATE